MNIPNVLTLFRIILAFVCVMLILQLKPASLIYAFLVFLLASFTDFLDGFIARRSNAISDLGKLLDPIADKILILGVFLAFLVTNVINVWMVIIIMMREFIITGIRLMALNRGYVLEAKRFGKHKTLSQMIGINFIFIVLILKQVIRDNKIIDFVYSEGIFILMSYIVIVTAFIVL